MSCTIHSEPASAPSAAHAHAYLDPATAQTTVVHVDAAGIVAVDEAALEGLLLRLGMVETAVPDSPGRTGRGGPR